jgi:predicted nucleotide-binding protein (sugar kinase/HSP70/actin superfamily)
MWRYFFEELDCEIVESPNTTKYIIDEGIKYTNDEMCLSLKIYMGHVSYLKDKCDFLLIPRIDNYGITNQTCTNFLSLYDIVNNTFKVKIINYNIDTNGGNSELHGLIKIGKELKKSRFEVIRAYQIALIKQNKIRKKQILTNYSKLSSNKLKVLVVGHPYNIYDNYVGMPITNFLKKLDVEIIYADRFDAVVTNKLSKSLSKTLYWKYNKELIGAIKLVERQIDGIVFVSSFPCGPDSLVNELVMRRISLPYVNLIIDDINSITGIETRLESFVDILGQKKQSIN